MSEIKLDELKGFQDPSRLADAIYKDMLKKVNNRSEIRPDWHELIKNHIYAGREQIISSGYLIHYLSNVKTNENSKITGQELFNLVCEKLNPKDHETEISDVAKKLAKAGKTTRFKDVNVVMDESLNKIRIGELTYDDFSKDLLAAIEETSENGVAQSLLLRSFETGSSHLEREMETGCNL